MLIQNLIKKVGKVIMGIKKVFIGVGHGGNDSGAINGKIKEKDINLIMALACQKELERHNVEVFLSRSCDENDTVEEEVRECNAFSPDVAIDIHNNAGGGVGFEVYHSVNGGMGKTLAENIWDEVNYIGQVAHGSPVKTRKNSVGSDYYWFIRGTKCPAVITEGAFIDNVCDYSKIDTIEEQEVFGVAYAKGILKTLGILYKDTDSVKPESSKDDKLLYRVQVGAFSIRENAEKMLERLERDGYEAFITKTVEI